MNKQDIYNALKADGAKLKPINFCSLEQLVEIYTERFGKYPDASDMSAPPDLPDKPDTPNTSGTPAKTKAVEIHTLVFNSSGWCEELKTSYFNGVYRPATVKEYLILRKYAAREI